jgi:hypothetical protein
VCASDAGWKFIGLLCEKKDHVCPSGSLRVNKKNEKLKKKKERGRREQNGRSTLVSVFFREQP